MTLKEFANVDSFCRDLNTGKEIPYEEYMGRIIEKLGINNIKRYIPFSLDVLKEKLKDDVHLNNTPMCAWDAASGYMSYIDKKTKIQDYKSLNGGVADLFVHNRITTFSVAECVSVLKNAAIMLCGVNIITKYQAYAWNGNDYLPISVPIYSTREEAIHEAENIIMDKENESVLNSIRLHWKEFPIITREKKYYA